MRLTRVNHMKPLNIFPYDSNFDFIRLRFVSLAVAAPGLLLLWTLRGAVNALPESCSLPAATISGVSPAKNAP